jgi:hypothetical protein
LLAACATAVMAASSSSLNTEVCVSEFLSTKSLASLQESWSRARQQFTVTIDRIRPSYTQCLFNVEAVLLEDRALHKLVHGTVRW